MHEEQGTLRQDQDTRMVQGHAGTAGVSGNRANYPICLSLTRNYATSRYLIDLVKVVGRAKRGM